MPRQSTITFEQVAVVADQIKASGGKPSCRAIREFLETGSMATILKHLRIWQNNQSRQSQNIDDTIDPSIYKSISDHVTARVQNAIASCNAQIAELQEETNTIITENERQAVEIEERSMEFLALQERYAALAGRTQQLEAELERTLADLNAERKAAEASRVSIAKAELRLEGFHKMMTEFASVRRDLDGERQKSAQLHEAAAVAEARLETAKEIIAALREQQQKAPA